MRARAGERAFCEWLLELGNGTLQSTHPDASPGHVDIPAACNLTSNIVYSIFPEFNVDRSQSVILTPKNEDTYRINNSVLWVLNPEQESIIYHSVDIVVEDEGNDVRNLSVEFLNSLTPSGMPQSKIELKVGCPIMLLRNLNAKGGLCNGTRLIVRTLGRKVIEAEIITGCDTFVGKRVFIPRIKLIPSDSNLPFKFQRTQFPIRLAYCMTINKSQGQTFNKVGIYLPQPVFSHGQLYVAFSRARCFEDIYVEIKNSNIQSTHESGGATTVNVVFNV